MPNQVLKENLKEELWQAVLAQIQFHISPANFATWFKNTKISSKKDGQLVVSVPNNFTKEWLENKYNKIILNILYNLGHQVKKIKYAVATSKVAFDQDDSDLSIKRNSIPLSKSNQLEFQELKIDKKTNLNPCYTFENFIVGSFNELAHAAALAISKNPGLVYNPLFVYGEVGIGKTHLIQAIGNEIARNFPSKKVKYAPAEYFTSEIITSIKNHNIENIKAKYREINVLIIDDIQFLAGKEKTQEEFFHLFNSLHERNNQIILSSDRPPRAISRLEERLRSRFEGGMIADIGSPDFETRIAILKSKAQSKGINFSDKIHQYIASNIQTNIRELEGALNRLIAYRNLNNQPPNLEIAQSLLKNLIKNPIKLITPKKIIQVVAEFYDLTPRDLMSATRKREIVEPRQIAMYILREELSSSYPAIGRIFGGRDHTTVIHACEKITAKIQNSERLADELKLIEQRINSG